MGSSILLVACGILVVAQDLVPWPGIEPGPPNPFFGNGESSHWATREVLVVSFEADSITNLNS